MDFGLCALPTIACNDILMLCVRVYVCVCMRQINIAIQMNQPTTKKMIRIHIPIFQSISKSTPFDFVSVGSAKIQVVTCFSSMHTEFKLNRSHCEACEWTVATFFWWEKFFRLTNAFALTLLSHTHSICCLPHIWASFVFIRPNGMGIEPIFGPEMLQFTLIMKWLWKNPQKHSNKKSAQNSIYSKFK